jgi:hypothetical protein
MQLVALTRICIALPGGYPLAGSVVLRRNHSMTVLMLDVAESTVLFRLSSRNGSPVVRLSARGE